MCHAAVKHSNALTNTTAATAAPQISIYWVVICRFGISSGVLEETLARDSAFGDLSV